MEVIRCRWELSFAINFELNSETRLNEDDGGGMSRETTCAATAVNERSDYFMEMNFYPQSTSKPI